MRAGKHPVSRIWTRVTAFALAAIESAEPDPWADGRRPAVRP
ncbi:MAG: hypothetical protein ACRDRZ_18675 [Pseudonocardiaceae bacterium]